MVTESSPASRRADAFAAARRRERWASGWALLIALLLHYSVIVLLPHEWLLSASFHPRAEPDPLEVTWLPPEPFTPEELRFVEANPQAAENQPDRTKQYSFRNQQAASPHPSAETVQAPPVEGEASSHKIVQGTSPQAAEPLPPGLYSPTAPRGRGEGTDGGQAGGAAARAVAQAAPLPAPKFIQQKPLREDGPGSRLEIPETESELQPPPDPAAPIEVYQPAAASDVTQTGAGAGGAVEAKPLPRQRPRLAPELVQGPLMRSRGSVSRRGTLAIDATFSEFGEYQQQFYAALQAGWYQEIEFFQPIDTAARVVVAFLIKADGSIHDIEVLHSTAGEIATLICQTAISKRSPFRPWTREMVQVFGQQRTLRVVFHYR
jgi:hypothetical protein